MSEQKDVGVIMGSQSDWPTMEKAVAVLKQLGISHECRVVSAHRTPDRLAEYARGAAERGLKVIIAGAGGAAHLPGMTSAMTHLPVLGVPVQSRALSGVDSLYSIVQMPGGIPTATFAIGESGATNAALEAARILALFQPELRSRLIEYSRRLTDSVSAFIRGEVIIEGKTKRVWGLIGEPDIAALEAKDDITAGDGKKHDQIPGKAQMATATTVNVFTFLRQCGIPLAFVGADTRTSFIAKRTQMLPYEVVMRGEADGSYCERHPKIAKGTRFDSPLVEFYLKTKGKKWKEYDLLCDDPFVRLAGNKILLFDPHKELEGQAPFLMLDPEEVYTQSDEISLIADMSRIGLEVFSHLGHAWESQQGRLIDLKIEFGMHAGRLLVSDVIDNDSWRVWRSGRYIDKQRYRNGENLIEVADDYRLVSELTAAF